ncbi:MAG TPA: YihY/virulence factor BrkB family protein [Angustibacter sp.]|nr:YihY/virulence factor BrkB family protein [Angustibacter sp.]
MTRAAPDDVTKADDPGDLRKPTWKFIARRVPREFMDDDCTDLAASLTYYGVLSVFPAATAVLSLIGVFGKGHQTVDTLLGVASDVGMRSTLDTVRQPLYDLSTSSSAGWALVLSLLVALWSASTYVSAFGRAMNRIYEIEEGRPFWKQRPLMMFVALVGVLLVSVVALGLVVSGPLAAGVGRVLGLTSQAVTVFNVVKWPVIVVLVISIIAMLYYATPNVQQPRFRWMSLGAFVALVVWVLASAAFALYVSKVGSYQKTYGALAGVVVFLLWLWLTNLALLFGAEVNAEMERGRQLQAGIEAERELQLPMRDRRGIRKRREREREQVARGRALREHAVDVREHDEHAAHRRDP